MALPPSPLARGATWQLDDTTLQRLAQELARDVYPLKDVLDRFGIDAIIFKTLVRPNPVFAQFFKEAHTMWHSSGNANERVQLKASSLFEDWLSEADRLFHDTTAPMAPKIELLKTVGRVAGLDREKTAGNVAPGERVLVQINLQAAGAQPITIDKIAPPVIDITPHP